MQDMFGKELNVGDRVIKAALSGRSAYVQIREIIEIVDGKIRLDGANPFVRFPKRLVKITEDLPLSNRFPWS